MEEQTQLRDGVMYEVLAGELRESILGGEYKPGQQLDSEAQLCRRFGVSRGPVRQALATLVQERLVSRVPGKGTFVSEHSGRQKRSKQKLGQIAVLIDASGSLDDNFCVLEILEGINQAAGDLAGQYKFVYEFHRFSDERDHFASDMFSSDEYDGFLIIPFTHYCVDFLSVMPPTTSAPVVGFFRHIHSEAITQYYIDHEAAAYRAAQLLISFGHKRIAMLLTAERALNIAGRERLSGCKRAMREAGIDGDAMLSLRVNNDPQSIRHATRQLLADTESPTALMISGGLMVPAATQAIRAAGLSVPDDLSVIAFDDVPEAMSHEPPLTVVKQPLIRGVKAALGRLLYEIEHPGQAPISSAICPEIILRESIRVRHDNP